MPVLIALGIDPPFLIVHGEKDEGVPNSQSRVLHSWLKLSGVPSELIVEPGAPHFGVMFDAADIRERIIAFLGKNLRQAIKSPMATLLFLPVCRGFAGIAVAPAAFYFSA